MSRIEELIREKCPKGVEYKPLSDKSLFDLHYGKGNKIPEDIGGIYDVYGANGVVSHIDEYNCEDVSIIGHIGAVGMVNRCRGKCFVTYNGTIASVVDNLKVDTQYFYYVLTGLNLASYKKGNQPFLSISDFENIEIPVPPIEVQQEIVRILNKFTELEAELQAELDARKKQYEHYSDELLAFSSDVEIVPLEKCAEIGTGSGNTVDGIEGGLYPFYVRSQKPLTMDSYEFDEIATITAGDGVGVGKVFHFVNGKYALHQRAYRIHITDGRINPKFFHYYFMVKFPKFIFGNMCEGSVPSIRRPMLNKFEVPVPSLQEQNRIVEILDKFEEYCNNPKTGLPVEIAARHKQYEYYRDKLLTFKRKEV